MVVLLLSNAIRIAHCQIPILSTSSTPDVITAPVVKPVGLASEFPDVRKMMPLIILLRYTFFPPWQTLSAQRQT